MRQLNIHFWDLNKKAQRKVLDFYDLEHCSDGNLDIGPLFTLDYEPEDEDES